MLFLSLIQINDRGELSIWRGLDYEQVQKYELRIVATDGFFTDFANVTVNLMDVNGTHSIMQLIIILTIKIGYNLHII